MNNALRTIKDYELFIYTLTEQFPVIQRSTLRLIRRGTTLARVEGELYFTKDVWIAIRERIVYHRLPAVIDEYGYEIRQKEKNYTGTILNHILMIRLCKALIPITSIFRQT